MRVVIVYKWARDPGAAAVRADGSVDWHGAKMAAGEDDPAALAAAQRIATTSGGELVGLTLGSGDASWALARGVQTACSVTDAPALADNAATAAIIAAAVRHIGDVDVLVIGDAEQDPGVAVAVAGHLRWPALVAVTSATAEDGQVLATRRTPEGTATLRIGTPVVVGIAAEADVDRVPGMKELLAARKRPLTTLTLAQVGATAGDVESRGSELPPPRATHVFEGTPEQVAGRLVAALRAEGVL